MNERSCLAIRNHTQPGTIYKVLYNARITVNTDERRAAHVLHYTYTVTLWSLAGANESPLCIVKLARRNQLPCLLNGRTNTPQV